MKKFITATLIFCAIAVVGILFDALWLDVAWTDMPNLLYYTLGWLAAGVYVALSKKESE